MELDLSEYMGAYIDGSRENLDLMDKKLLELEQNPSNIEAVGEIFRAAHTLKGMSATMGFEKIAHLTHEMENLLDKLRNNQLAVTSPVIDLIFETFDILRTLVEDSINNTESSVDLSEISSKLTAMANGTAPSVSASKAVASSLGNVSSKTITTGSSGVDLGVFGLSELEISGLEGSKDNGNHITYLKVTLVPDCLLKGPRVFMIIRSLEDIQAEIIKSVPDTKDLENEKFDTTFEMLLACPKNYQDVKESIDGISEVEKIETSDVNPNNLSNFGNSQPTAQIKAPQPAPVSQPAPTPRPAPISQPAQAPRPAPIPEPTPVMAPQPPVYAPQAPAQPVYPQQAPGMPPMYGAPGMPYGAPPMYQAPVMPPGYGMPQMYPQQAPGMPYGAPPMYMPHGAPQAPYGTAPVTPQPSYVQQTNTPVSLPTAPAGPAIVQPATPPQQPAQPENQEGEEEKEVVGFTQLITFTMAGEVYALEISQIETIINLANITRVPKAPSHIDGVINLRGEIIPVINTRRRLKLPQVERSPLNQIIIISFEEEKVKVGFLVDSVQEVIRMPETAMEPPTRVSESVDIEYLKSVGKIDNKIIILLNAHRIVFDNPKEESGKRE